ncbi:MAG: L-threonylcarbamoyladenylate synthase [Vicinamibacterales bacterium]
MKLSTDSAAPDPAAIERAADLLRAGRIVAGPTDTLYGLFGDPHQAAAIDAIYSIKGRQEGQPLPLVACSRAQVESLAGPLGGATALLASRFWPGPLTLLVAAWPGLDARVHGGTGVAAVRVPDHVVARALAEAAGFPLVATSANLAGEPAVADAAAIDREVAERVSLVLDAGPTPGGLPSTIVDARGSVPVLLRPGAIAWTRVLESLQ